MLFRFFLLFITLWYNVYAKDPIGVLYRYDDILPSASAEALLKSKGKFSNTTRWVYTTDIIGDVKGATVKNGTVSILREIYGWRLNDSKIQPLISFTAVHFMYADWNRTQLYSLLHLWRSHVSKLINPMVSVDGKMRLQYYHYREFAKIMLGLYTLGALKLSEMGAGSIIPGAGFVFHDYLVDESITGWTPSVSVAMKRKEHPYLHLIAPTTSSRLVRILTGIERGLFKHNFTSTRKDDKSSMTSTITYRTTVLDVPGSLKKKYTGKTISDKTFAELAQNQTITVRIGLTFRGGSTSPEKFLSTTLSTDGPEDPSEKAVESIRPVLTANTFDFSHYLFPAKERLDYYTFTWADGFTGKNADLLRFIKATQPTPPLTESLPDACFGRVHEFYISSMLRSPPVFQTVVDGLGQCVEHVESYYAEYFTKLALDCQTKKKKCGKKVMGHLYVA